MRVIIADDEQKVCQLIYDLVPWENYGMTVVGICLLYTSDAADE